jgi:hypothetical protein
MFEIEWTCRDCVFLVGYDHTDSIHGVAFNTTFHGGAFRLLKKAIKKTTAGTVAF